MPRIARGLDGCPDGWVVVTLHDGRVHDVEVVDALTQVPDEAGAVAVDIPIGLVDAETREADRAARAALPGRASSVFNAPPRCVFDALEAAGGDGTFGDAEVFGYAAASALCRERTGKGLSRQSWALAPRILEVDLAVRAGWDLLEVHPELAFAEVAGEVLPRKRSWAGIAARWRLLERLGIELPTRFVGDRCAPDDVLDAAICAWVADGAAAGEVMTSYPHAPSQSDPRHPDRRLAIVARPLPSRLAGR